MYKINIYIQEGREVETVLEEVIETLVGLTPEAVRTEIYDRGWGDGYRAGEDHGYAEGYEEASKITPYIVAHRRTKREEVVDAIISRNAGEKPLGSRKKSTGR